MADDSTNLNPNPASRRPDAVVLAVFATEHQAKLAAGLLEAQDIACWLHTDDCGGMLFPLDEGVRLLVLPEQAAEARAILSAEASPNLPPSETSPGTTLPPSPRPKIALLQITGGIVMGVVLCLLYQWLSQLGTKTYQYDTNEDGKPDRFCKYRDGYWIEDFLDRNHDGRQDWWHYYDGRGNRTSSKSDDNFDGIVDTTSTYSNDVLVSSSADTDFNTVPDVTYTFAHELQAQADWRPNGTNAVTLRQHFKHGVLTEEQRDTNADGTFDISIGYDPFLNAISTNSFRLLSLPPQRR